MKIGDSYLHRAHTVETEIIRYPGGFLLVSTTKHYDPLGNEHRFMSSTFVTNRDMFSS